MSQKPGTGFAIVIGVIEFLQHVNIIAIANLRNLQFITPCIVSIGYNLQYSLPTSGLQQRPLVFSLLPAGDCLAPSPCLQMCSHSQRPVCTRCRVSGPAEYKAPLQTVS